MSKTSRIQSNLIQQNCFVRDVSNADDLRSTTPDSFFKSLDQESTDNGIKFVENDYPYPITPQYVNSFVDSSDYRKDVSGAISNGVKRSNLGDIRGVQDLSAMDTASARSLYESLKAKFESNPVESNPVESNPVVDGGNS